MSDEHEKPGLLDVIGDLATSLDGIPAPIKRNLLKAAGALVTGLVDVPAAFLEMKAAQFKARQSGHQAVMSAAARNAAALAGKSPEIADRALEYFANDLVREQANREAIVKQAIDATNALFSPSPAGDIPPIDDDWLHQFRKLASSKSNAEVQVILGRILAGEIHKPGSFAPYTLEAVARLDQSTAQAFEFVANHAFIIPDRWDIIVLSVLGEDGVGLEPLLNPSVTLHLTSCGLVTSSGLSQIAPEAFLLPHAYTLGGQRVLFEKCEVENKRNLMMPMKGDAALLSVAGGQLQSIVPKTFDRAYARKLQTGLKRLGVTMIFPDINIDA
jgi:hypothetical protein